MVVGENISPKYDALLVYAIGNRTPDLTPGEPPSTDSATAPGCLIKLIVNN